MGGSHSDAAAESWSLDDDLNGSDDSFNLDTEEGDWGTALAAAAGGVRGRSQSVTRWSKAEDEQLRRIVEVHGPKNWKRIAEALGPIRTDMQCLHRWNKASALRVLFAPVFVWQSSK